MSAPLNIKCVIFETVEASNQNYTIDLFFTMLLSEWSNWKLLVCLALFQPQKATAEKQLLAEFFYWFSNSQSRAPIFSETPHGYVYMLFFTLESVSVYHQCTWLRIVDYSSECECSILYVPILYVNKTVCVLETLRLEQHSTLLNYQKDPVYLLLDS